MALRPKAADVIVLGAGAAGLAAARDCTAAGLNVTLLEARPRIGGRVHTIHSKNAGIPLELGAEFVHGVPESTWRLLRASRLAAYDVVDTHWQWNKGRLGKIDFWPAIERVLSKLTKLPSRGDMSFAAFLKKYAGSVPAMSRTMAISFIEGFNATDHRLVSAQSLRDSQAASEEIEEDRAFRIQSGYASLLDFVYRNADSQRLDLRLDTRAAVVKWSRRRVVVTTDQKEEFSARACIITLPLGVLQAGDLAIDPVPAAHQSAWRLMKMGSVVKVILRFEEPFWEKKKGMRDLCFLHAPAEAFPTMWTMLPLRVPILTGWSGGPAADRLSGKSPAAIVDAFLGTLSHVFGLSKGKLRAMLQTQHVADWPADPLSRGAYSYCLVGGAQSPRILAKPHAGTLFFAGEHTHARETGSVAAALETGRRAAKQVIRSLHSV